MTNFPSRYLTSDMTPIKMVDGLDQNLDPEDYDTPEERENEDKID